MDFWRLVRHFHVSNPDTVRNEWLWEDYMDALEVMEIEQELERDLERARAREAGRPKR